MRQTESAWGSPGASAYLWIDRLLRGLRDALEAAGVGAEAVTAMLANPDVPIGWDLAGIPAAGPSLSKGARDDV